MRDLVNDGALWQTLDTSSFCARIPPKQLVQLLERASSFVQNLNLRGCSQLVDTTTLKFSNLIAVNFEGCRWLTSDSLIRLLSQNPKLKHLNISALNTVDDGVLQTITAFCVSLESINISYCQYVTEPAVNSLVQGLQQMQDLRIGECRISQDTVSIINSLKNLKRLCLAGCTDLEDDWVRTLLYGELPYGVIVPETRFKSSLQHLDLSRCRHLSSECLKYLHWVLPDLQKLELAGLTALADTDLSRLLDTLPRLTHIDLEDCSISDSTLFALARCQQLRHVQLSHCSRISDAGVLSMIEHLPLNYLDLSNTHISDVVLAAISTCPQRMRISLYDCSRLSWTGVLSILTSNSARPRGLKRLKTFYGWQRPVDGHTKRCMAMDIAGAKEVEREWAAYMIASSEESMRTGEGRTRVLDFDEQELRIVGRETCKHTKSCTVM